MRDECEMNARRKTNGSDKNRIEGCVASDDAFEIAQQLCVDTEQDIDIGKDGEHCLHLDLDDSRSDRDQIALRIAMSDER